MPIAGFTNLVGYRGWRSPQLQTREKPFPLGLAPEEIQRLFFDQFLPPHLPVTDLAHLALVNKFARKTIDQNKLIELAFLEELKECLNEVNPKQLLWSYSNLVHSYIHPKVNLDLRLLAILIPFFPVNKSTFQLIKETTFYSYEFENLIKLQPYLDPYRPFFDEDLRTIQDKRNLSNFSLFQSLVFEIRNPSPDRAKIKDLIQKSGSIRRSTYNYDFFLKLTRILFFPEESEILLQNVNELHSLIRLVKRTYGLNNNPIINRLQVLTENKARILFNPQKPFEIYPDLKKIFTMNEEDLAAFIELISFFNRDKALEFIKFYDEKTFNFPPKQLAFLKNLFPLFLIEIEKMMTLKITKWFECIDHPSELFDAIIILGSIKPETLITNLLKFKDHVNDIPLRIESTDQKEPRFVQEASSLNTWNSTPFMVKRFPEALFKHPKTIIQLCRTHFLEPSGEVKLLLLLKTIHTLPKTNSNHLLEQEAREILEPLWDNLYED